MRRAAVVLVIATMLLGCYDPTEPVEVCEIVYTHDPPALAPVPDTTLPSDAIYADTVCVAEGAAP